MTIELDPQQVRQIAREHLSDFLRGYPRAEPFFVGGRVLDVLGDPDLVLTEQSTYTAWCDAVVADISAATAVWSDEFPQELAAPIEVHSFADLCEALDQLGVTFVGELRMRDDQQPRGDRDVLLAAVGAVLWEHSGSLAGPLADPNLAELAHVWLAAGPDDPETEAEVRAALNPPEPEPDICRPVMVTDMEGECTTIRVHGGREMDEQETAAFGEVVRAAQRKMREDLRRRREEREAEVKAVARMLRELRTNHPEVMALKAVTRVEERFAGPIAELASVKTEEPS